ncbi:sensor histidine kinase [Neotamlana laminarinivorans]|uniref:Histidine kinase n=1 Tax=Neotamlana laminarinivorans TaxID=2883124 RepID=A0A9X1I425_9FLAO|nr:histidine kinase [Tamlana laminarinivorans]MCB4800047.1 histidine kinase [Tamlana laminarinivorans]
MSKNNKITLFAHLLAWLVLFSIPYILSYGQEQNINRIIAHFWIPILFYAVIFYSNYFVLVDRFLFKKETLLFILINVLIITICITIKEQIESAVFPDISRPIIRDGDGPSLKMMIYVQMFSYLAPLLFSIAIKTTKRWVKTEAERKEAANFKLQSELQHLHYQLQPHFFFNSLNNIYALVDISPVEAKSSIHSLSKLMRYMLYETNVDKVFLSKEIEFLQKYIELMKLRLSDKTKVNYTFPSTETGIKIAPLLFISLIENAFKHGVSASNVSHINMEMICENTAVIFKINNNNYPKQTTDKSGSGIGLQNLEKRLQLLYPNKFEFNNTLENNIFSVILKIETS